MIGLEDTKTACLGPGERVELVGWGDVLIPDELSFLRWRTIIELRIMKVMIWLHVQTAITTIHKYIHEKTSKSSTGTARSRIL